MHLAENSQIPSTQARNVDDCEFGGGHVEEQDHASFRPSDMGSGLRVTGQSASARSTSCPSQSQGVAPHKVRGPNWTEAEMLVLIGQKRIEWDVRHNCNQPSLARFVYGTTAWKTMLAGCLDVVGFRVRDTDQITNK